jgi:hypothetical protein
MNNLWPNFLIKSRMKRTRGITDRKRRFTSNITSMRRQLSIIFSKLRRKLWRETEWSKTPSQPLKHSSRKSSSWRIHSSMNCLLIITLLRVKSRAITTQTSRHSWRFRLPSMNKSSSSWEMNLRNWLSLRDHHKQLSKLRCLKLSDYHPSMIISISQS